MTGNRLVRLVLALALALLVGMSAGTKGGKSIGCVPTPNGGFYHCNPCPQVGANSNLIGIGWVHITHKDGILYDGTVLSSGEPVTFAASNCP